MGEIVKDSRLYLDKFMTLPHLPHSSSETPYEDLSTLPKLQVIPSLAHTGIQTMFETYSEPSMMPNGSLNPAYVTDALDKSRAMARSMIKLKSMEPRHCKDHRKCIDKVLLNMEASRSKKSLSLTNYFLREKNELGFGSELGIEASQSHRLRFENDVEELENTLSRTVLKKKSTKHKKNHIPQSRPKRIYSKDTLFQCMLENPISVSDSIKETHYGTMSSRNMPVPSSNTWDQSAVSYVTHIVKSRKKSSP